MVISPLVSIVIPVYNASRYLSTAIDSVLSQAYDNIELLIIDDCSSDNSIDIANKYKIKDSRVKIFKNDHNCKQAYTRNIGIKLAIGKYLAFLDADDIMSHSRIEKQVTFLEENKDILVCGGQVKYININGEILDIKFELPLLPDEVKAYAYLVNNPIIQSTAIIRLNDFVGAKFSYDESIGDIAEDYHLWLDIMNNGYKIANLDFICAYYRCGDIEQTTNRLKNIIENEFNITLYNNVYKVCNNSFMSRLYVRIMARKNWKDFVLYVLLNFVLSIYIQRLNLKYNILNSHAVRDVMLKNSVLSKIKKLILRKIRQII